MGSDSGCRRADLNDLVHAGGHHLGGHIGDESIEPHYPDRHVKWLIVQGIEVRIRVGCELFELMGDEQGIGDLEAYVDSHFVRPLVRDGGGGDGGRRRGTIGATRQPGRPSGERNADWP